MTSTKTKGLLDRLKDGESVICAEGYLFEIEQRGYLKAGAFVPEVVIEHPDVVRMLHEEFVHAGSDVVEAFTYYGHRRKMSLIGREDDLENLNRGALRMARQVADKTNTLMAGNICNTTVYNPDDEEACRETESIFKEQIVWAAEEGADFIIGETFGALGEAMLALRCIKEYGRGLPAVVTFATVRSDWITTDGVGLGDACRQLEEAGAAVVGLNCYRGPETIMPALKEVRKACKGPIAALPVPYRTTPDHPRMQDLKDAKDGTQSFPGNLNPWHCSRQDIAEFTRQARALGVQYLGLCCGSQAHYVRTMAEALGRHPPASKYSPDMTQHFSRLQGQEYQYAKNNFHKALGT